MTSLLTSLLIILGRDQRSYMHTRDLEMLPQASTRGFTPQPSRVLLLGMLITIVMQPPSLLPYSPTQDMDLVLHQPLLDGLAVLFNPFLANSLQTKTGPSSPLTLHCLSLAIQRHLNVLIAGIKGGSNCKIATQSTFLHRHLLCWHHPLLLASSSSVGIILLCWHHPPLAHLHSTDRAGQCSPGRLVWICFPQCCTWEPAAVLPNEAEKPGALQFFLISPKA